MGVTKAPSTDVRPVIFVISEAMIPVSGVASWVFTLREKLIENDLQVSIFARSRKQRGLLNNVDATFHTTKEFEELLKQITAGHLVFMNTDSFVGCAMAAGVLNRSGNLFKTISVIHSDSEEEYYSRLGFFERSAQHLICVSSIIYNKTRDRLADQSPLNISMLPYGVPYPDLPDQAHQEGPIRIAYSGRIVQKQKRIFDFVKLTNHMSDNDSDFTITFFGSGPEEKKLKRDLSKHIKNGNVVLAGEIDHQLMLERWKDFDIFINLSDYEGTSVSMLEAMAHGVVPVVTEASSGVSEVIRNGENGYYRPVGDMQGIVECVRKLDRSRSQLSLMSQNARQTIKDRYTMDKYTISFISILKQLDTMNPYVVKDYEVDIYQHICKRDDAIKRILASWSYRIGRKLTYPSRTLKRYLSLLAD